MTTSPGIFSPCRLRTLVIASGVLGGVGLASVRASDAATALRASVTDLMRASSFSWSLAYERSMQVREHEPVTNNYWYHGVTDAQGCSVVQTHVHFPVAMRSDAEDPFLIVYHADRCLARIDNTWLTPLELTQTSAVTPKRRLPTMNGHEFGSIELPQPTRLLPALVSCALDLREDDDALAGTIGPADAERLFTSGLILPCLWGGWESSAGLRPPGVPGSAPRPPGVPAPGSRPRNRYEEAEGTVKFWLRDGVLQKYEVHIHAAEVSGPAQKLHRIYYDAVFATTLRDIGGALVAVPEEARVRLGI